MSKIGITNGKTWALLSVAPLLVLSGCRGEAGEQEVMAPPPPLVEVMEVKPRPVALRREYVGRTMGSREVDIHARVTGIIQQRLYDEGAPVEAGSALFRIDPEPFQVQVAAAEAELARARANFNRAERERRRLEPLADAKTVSEREVDDARSNVELAAAEVKRAEAALRDARIRLGYTTVTAPIDGISGIARKFEGALVNVGGDSLLTTVVQVDPLDVHFAISEIEWLTVQGEKADGSLRVPLDSELDVRLKLADGTIYDQGGRINFSAARIDEDTGTYALRARFPNPAGVLKAGQFVRVQVAGMTRPDAVAVPQKAVLQGPDGKFVFVAAEDESGSTVAEIRPVQVGEWQNGEDGETWVVRSGLRAGDRVILDNFVKLQPGAPVTLVNAGAGPSETAQAPGPR
jgi:membrane fusion protein, multidrug efflux system